MLGVYSEIFFYQFAYRLGEYKDWNVPASEASVEYGTHVSGVICDRMVPVRGKMYWWDQPCGMAWNGNSDTDEKEAQLEVAELKRKDIIRNY